MARRTMISILVLMFVAIGCAQNGDGITQIESRHIRKLHSEWIEIEQQMGWPVEVRERVGIDVSEGGDWWIANGIVEDLVTTERFCMLTELIAYNQGTPGPRWTDMAYLERDGSSVYVIERDDKLETVYVRSYEWTAVKDQGRWIMQKGTRTFAYSELGLSVDDEPIRDWAEWILANRTMSGCR